MNTLLVLQNRAVKAAQEERWNDARQINLEILDQDSHNIGALNRLGFSYLQSGKLAEAKKTYERVLESDRTNQVARKYLDVLAKKQPIVLPKALKHSDFIDEPGKTKSVQLVRLAGQEVLAVLSIGADCALQATKSRVGVHCEQKYIGSLPDDLAVRLRPLLEAGNRYSTKIQSLKNSTVTIFIREQSRDQAVAHITSFPTENLNVLTLDHELSRDEDSPVYSGSDAEEAGTIESAGIDEALDNEERYGDFGESSIDED